MNVNWRIRSRSADFSPQQHSSLRTATRGNQLRVIFGRGCGPKPYRCNWRHKLGLTPALSPRRGRILVSPASSSQFSEVRKLEKISTKNVASELENIEARKLAASLRLKSALRLLLLCACCFCFSSHARIDTILSSKHDLSAAGPGDIRATIEAEVCMFCHTPHRGTGELPLWNHTLSTATYRTYESSTTKATIGQPTGASKLCLSCHDGTVALGMVSSRSTTIPMRNNVTRMPVGPSNLGTDLSDDHPISFVYNSTLVASDGQLKDPAALTDKVRLDSTGQMQCTSCHDPHNNQYGKFLVEDNRGSTLCIRCHDFIFWQESSHRNSNKTWNGNGSNPWPHTSLTTVADNACESCHAPHAAGTKPRLLNWSDEEKNCYVCHSGTVAAKNIQAEFNKFSTHPILNTTGVHDPAEDLVNPPRHVECADCHNS